MFVIIPATIASTTVATSTAALKGTMTPMPLTTPGNILNPIEAYQEPISNLTVTLKFQFLKGSLNLFLNK